MKVPSIFSGKVDSINVKVGDKVSKGDLLINITNKEKISDPAKEVPKNTENLIKEAEKALELEKKQRPKIEKIEKEKSEIQFSKDGDIDPLETSEWLESLSAVIEKDGNHRAHYLIKELINKAYMEGANIPYTQNTPYINTIPVSEEKNLMVIKILREG